jgi:hypothetical protein
MTYGVSHSNDTDTGDDHTTDYGSGTALVVVLLGLVLLSVVMAAPYFYSDSWYQPLSYGSAQQQQRVVLVRADIPVLQGKPVNTTPKPLLLTYKQAAKATSVSVVSTPGNTLVGTVEMRLTPDLSCLKSV